MSRDAAAAAATDNRRKTSAETQGQMPPDGERRPAAYGAPSHESAAAPSVRRRREASLRCEPLSDGQRDPWTFTRPDPSAASLRGSRAAWEHLRFLGLLDTDGYVEGILRDLGGAA